MDQAKVQDLASRGMGRAARVIGCVCDVFRPRGLSDPLTAGNRVLRLHASFNAEDPAYRRAGSFGRDVWYGVFDAAYTRPGDYLRERASGAVWLVAGQRPLLPVLCVKAERVVSLFRETRPVVPGAGPYGGVTARGEAALLLRWPAGMVAAGGGTAGAAGLPADARLPAFSVLLPAVAGVVPRVADLVRDDLGRRFVVNSAELGELGWRLLVAQVAS